MAQFGSALDLGSRGHGFESPIPDHICACVVTGSRSGLKIRCSKERVSSSLTMRTIRAVSSFGRAPALHAGGNGFDPRTVQAPRYLPSRGGAVFAESIKLYGLVTEFDWRCEGQICSELITLTIKLNINANFIKNIFAKVKNFFAPATVAYTFA